MTPGPCATDADLLAALDAEHAKLRTAAQKLLSRGHPAARDGVREALAVHLATGAGHEGSGLTLIAAAWHAGNLLGPDGTAPTDPRRWQSILSALTTEDARVGNGLTHLNRTGPAWSSYWRGLVALLHSRARPTPEHGTGEEWRRRALAFVYMAGDHPEPMAVGRLAHERGTIAAHELERALAQQETAAPALRSGVL